MDQTLRSHSPSRSTTTVGARLVAPLAIVAILGSSDVLAQPICPPSQQTVAVDQSVTTTVPILGGPHDIVITILDGGSFIEVDPFSATGVESFAYTLSGITPGSALFHLVATQSPFSATCPVNVTVTGPPPVSTRSLGMLGTHTGPPVYDFQVASWIDRYFQDGSPGDRTVSSKVIAFFTQCYGGNWLRPLDGLVDESAFDHIEFQHSAIASASAAGTRSYYRGYHNDAAEALTPWDGTDVGDVHHAGFTGRSSREQPQIQGDLSCPIAGASSTHVLVWASEPEPLDVLDIAHLFNNFSGYPNLTFTVLAGDGQDAYYNGPATATALEAALQEIGELMDDGPDEHFVFFVTDHGGQFVPGSAAGPLRSSVKSSETFLVELDSEHLAALVADVGNRPAVALLVEEASLTPHQVAVALNGTALGTLADAQYVPAPVSLPGTPDVYRFALHDESLLELDSLTQAIELEIEPGATLAWLSVGLELGSVARSIGDFEPGSSCVPNIHKLCLAAGRFEVQTFWKTPGGRMGAGEGHTLGGDAGYFSFFGPSNAEVAVKILDARSLDGSFWVFHAGLSNLAYTVLVRDTISGRVQTYSNHLGTFGAGADTRTFAAPGGAGGVNHDPPRPANGRAALGEVECASGALCLRDQRFHVEVTHTNPGGGATLPGQPLVISHETGAFWFFREANPRSSSRSSTREA